MNHSRKDSRQVPADLIEQLNVLGEEKSLFLDAFFPVHGIERSRMDQFLTGYVEFVKRQLALDTANPCNAVFIGSKVTIAYPDSGEVDELTIVYPGEADPDCNRISFLSPLGKQLLMRAAGDVATVEVPSGPMRLHIREASLACAADGKEAISG